MKYFTVMTIVKCKGGQDINELALATGQKNYLFSYFYYKNKLDYLEEFFSKIDKPNIIVDSGAYSAYTQSLTISLDEYAEFILSLKKTKFANNCESIAYTNLDYLNARNKELSAQKSLDNIKELEKITKLKFLPVFHQGESMDFLEYYLDNYDYIGTSSEKSYHKNVRGDFYKSCLSNGRYKKIINKKIHGFGETTYSMLEAFPFYSCDSSSLGSIFRYGVSIFDSLTNLDKRNIDHQIYVYNKDIKLNIDRFTQITKLWESRGIKH